MVKIRSLGPELLGDPSVTRGVKLLFAGWLVLALIGSACGDRLSQGAAGSASPTSSGLPVSSVTTTAGSSVAGSAVAAIAVVVTAAPNGTLAPTPPPATVAPTPSPTIAPAPGGSLSLAQLKYRIVDRFGRLWFCDPDFYPVARADEGDLAEQRFPEIQKDAPTFSAIVAHLGYGQLPSYTHEQKLAIYRDWKMLNALRLDPAGGSYHFNARFTPDGRTGALVDGTVDPSGVIVVASQTPSGPPPCPICLARGTKIATPSGPVAVEDLREGSIVWTTDATGARAAARVLVVGSMTAPADHEVVHLVTADGRELYASPKHPLADGRPLGELRPGDPLDGSVVVSATLVPYSLGTTFDLLPAGATGMYWADGIPLGSTIAR